MTSVQKAYPYPTLCGECEARSISIYVQSDLALHSALLYH